MQLEDARAVHDLCASFFEGAQHGGEPVDDDEGVDYQAALG